MLEVTLAKWKMRGKRKREVFVTEKEKRKNGVNL